jgi:hypothetical protein
MVIEGIMAGMEGVLGFEGISLQERLVKSILVRIFR